MSHAQQLADSVNIVGVPVVTEMFFPLGLRYHALHHLFPTMPYHNLAGAHRRLMQQLPTDSVYRETVFNGFWSVVRQLLTDIDKSTSLSPGPSPATKWYARRANLAKARNRNKSPAS